jgi:hypothetical protein
MTQERVPFRLLIMPCCGAVICHVNHRWPSYCSMCGAHVFPDVKGCATLHDPDATLTYDETKLT